MKTGKSMPDSNKPSGAGMATGAGVRKLLHDFNQPLTAISNYAQAGSHLIDNGLSDTARLKELFEKISMQCKRTNLLSQELGDAVSALLPGEDLA